LYDVNLVILTFVFGAVLLVLTLAIVRRRATREPPPSPALRAELLPPDGSPARSVRVLSPVHERRLLRSVVAATLVTLGLLLLLLSMSVITGKALDSLDNEGALSIELTGQQWWWRARYLDDDASQIVITANELHIPVGRPVRFELTSNDVIHSFWVPNLHGKRDLVPGHRTSLVLQADRAGVYRGQCAEFCGHGHADMALWIIAESPAAFAAWRKQQLTPPPAPATEQQKRGQEVFLSGPCVLCHAVSGTVAQASVGPDLSHLMTRRSLGADALPNTRGHLAGWILNSQSSKPGNHMPNLSLPAEDLHALLSYLETLR
jgi:cytochrome c oxidase subunit 2